MSLFTPGEVGLPQVGEFWCMTKDGDPYERHYSCRPYRDKRIRRLFCGPGYKTVLISPCGLALFVWRKFIDDSGQQGVNCAVFRNETRFRSSDMILDAETIARTRWAGERLYTYVDGSRTIRRRGRQNAPGHCFLMAGWRPCGFTKSGLHILEKLP